ncbi:MAG: alanine--tRNA ligase [Deltaproteobacteria bacterium]|nr:alanine--tRNA ligase [Deltaproteobacteria bacterium]
MDAATIRTKFLEFFARHQHQMVRSSSIVPQNDPTLYFTNAGMVQFKDVFVGAESRPYTRAVTAQKCLRVSGKHNDLESVGRTARHHTFFEMLGNFSFGDYFKADAIRFAWSFLTEEIGLDPTRMAGTVFAGEDGIAADEEAAALWQKEVGLPAERVVRLGKADNFWAMGDTGPCGPCSEIHYFQGAHLPCTAATCLGVACECDRWVEIWNLVFMQFERQPDGRLVPLKRTGVDTGMGLERLAAVSQGKTSTFETDLLRPLIDLTAELARKKYGAGGDQDVSLRVVADHARATAFCIADGVFPEKGGREYVLRRIMRRAIRHGSLLGFDEPFFHKVCDQVVERMGAAYPELVERRELIQRIVQAEEAAFRRTLTRGLQKLQEAVGVARSAGERTLAVSFVGDLYATDGFPLDLTRIIAEEAGLAVDEEAAQKWVVQTHGAGDSKVGDEAVAAIYKELLEELGPTEFVGYDETRGTSEVLALLVGGARVASAVEGQTVEVVTRSTPFYGRAGGQVGDTGRLVGPHGEVEASDTLKPGGALVVHQGRVVKGRLATGERLELQVDSERRQAIRLNHSATHLLHHALRSVLGPHVAQKGSLVGPDYLRFDFSHFEPMTDEQLRRVEELVNREIRGDGESRTDLMSFDEARQTGAMALFGEKYGDRVRVVHVGSASVELCGGTHVRRAGEIGLLRITSEESLAMGVRRITALTGAGALAHAHATEETLRAVAQLLRCGPEQAAERVERLLGQLKEVEREVATLKQKLATGGGTDLMARVQELKGVRLLVTRVESGEPKVLREAGDTLRDRLGSGVLVLAGEHEGKATLLAMVTKDLVGRVHAGKLVGALAEMLDGRGGGRPDMAQAGGPRLELLDEALAKVPELVSASLG